MTSGIVRASLAALAFILAAGCQQPEIRVCEGESERVEPGGHIVESKVRTVLDPTAGGVLAGAPPVTPGRPMRMFLLLDYSGSMLPGWGREADPPACADRCTWAASRQPPAPGRRGPAPVRPDYYYARPEFRDLVAGLVAAATPAGADVGLEVVLFNRQPWRVTATGVEPFDATRLAFDRKVGDAPAEALGRSLEVIPPNPFHVPEGAPIDAHHPAAATHSTEALRTVLDAVPDEAVVWIVTDNIADMASGHVDGADAARNGQFYRELEQRPEIQAIATYPLHQPDECGWMCGTSLIVYGLYVSKRERSPSEELHRLWGVDALGAGPQPTGWLWNPALAAYYERHGGRADARPELRGVPLRLKPLDRDVLHVAFDTAHCGQALCCRRAEFGDKLACSTKLVVRNVLRHQRVTGAQLRLTNGLMLPRKPDDPARVPWASAVCDGTFRSVRWLSGTEGEGERIELGALEPLSTREIEVLFEVPAIDVAFRGARELLDVAVTENVQLHGTIRAEVEGVATELFLDTSGMEAIYGLPQLPRFFRQQDRLSLYLEHPASALVRNDGQLLAMIVIGVGALVLVLVVLGTMLLQRVHYTLVLNGVQHERISLRRFSAFPVVHQQRTQARVRRGFGGTPTIVAAKGYRQRPDGGAWVISRGAGGDADELRVELRPGWGTTRRAAGQSVDSGF